jgi:hypothetical protein
MIADGWKTSPVLPQLPGVLLPLPQGQRPVRPDLRLMTVAQVTPATYSSPIRPMRLGVNAVPAVLLKGPLSVVGPGQGRSNLLRVLQAMGKPAGLSVPALPSGVVPVSQAQSYRALLGAAQQALEFAGLFDPGAGVMAKVVGAAACGWEAWDALADPRHRDVVKATLAVAGMTLNLGDLLAPHLPSPVKDAVTAGGAVLPVVTKVVPDDRAAAHLYEEFLRLVGRQKDGEGAHHGFPGTPPLPNLAFSLPALPGGRAA